MPNIAQTFGKPEPPMKGGAGEGGEGGVKKTKGGIAKTKRKLEGYKARRTRGTINIIILTATPTTLKERG